MELSGCFHTIFRYPQLSKELDSESSRDKNDQYLAEITISDLLNV